VAAPVAARGLSIAGALAVLALVIVPAVDTLIDDPITAIGGLAAGLPFLVFLTWIAVAPDHADDQMTRIGVDLSEPRHLVGLAIHVAFAWIVFAGTIIRTTEALSVYLETGQHPAASREFGGAGIVFGLVLSLILFVVAAVTWLWLVDDRDLDGMVEELRLELDGLPRGVVWGVLATLAGFVILAGVSFVLQQLGVQPDNPQADAIANALSPWSAVLVAALAGMGEELYFRGFLLDRVGNLAQAGLFAIVHATYLTAFQVILPFARGLAVGWLVRKTNLWTAIISHTLFNAVMLLVAIYASESGGLALVFPL
jgi:membrane protease YdiL (CAAX protease family)